MDLIALMKEQAKDCQYKPTVIILSFSLKVHQFKLKKISVLNTQIRRVAKLYQNRFENTKINRIEYSIELEDGDSIKGLRTIKFLFELHQIISSE